MWFPSFLGQKPGLSHPAVGRKRRGPASRQPASRRLLVEALEDRCLLSFSPAVSYPAGVYPYAVASGDFDNDAVQDLAVANYISSSVSVLLGNGDGTFEPAQDFATGANPVSLAVGDFDSDGNLDLATANASGYDASVLLGNGDGTLDAPTSASIGSSPTSVAVGDFNDDGLLDLGVTSNFYTPGFYGGPYGYYWYPGYYTSYANVLVGNGAGGFAGPNSTFLGFSYHTAAAVADFNGDGIDDFATANPDYATVSVLFGDAGGFLQGPTDYFTGSYPLSLAAADVDGDLDADLVAANYFGNDVGVLLGDGLGGFAGPQNYATGGYSSSVALGDFNGDLVLDVATANSVNDTMSVLRGVGDGSFASPLLTATGASPLGLAVGDFNADGWLDAVTANSGGNNVSILLNTQDWRSFQVGGYPSPIIVGETHSVTVTALEDDGNALTGYTGTVHFSSSDPLAGLPDDYTFTAADSGTKTFSVTLGTVGTQSIAVNDTTTPAFSGQQTGIVVNPPPPASLSIDDVTVTEGDSGTVEAIFTVTRGDNLDGAVTVNFSTGDGGARAGSDYIATGGTLTFGPGVTSQTIIVLVNGDVTDEYDQAFYVYLWDASGADIIDSQGEGMITDNDAAPTISITAMVSAKEGKNNVLTPFNFIVTLSAASEKEVRVNFTTANDTATTADNDYVTNSGTLVFGLGETSKTIAVQVRGDKRKESNETFFVNLSGAENATILAGQGLGEILDDDAPPGKGRP